MSMSPQGKLHVISMVIRWHTSDLEVRKTNVFTEVFVCFSGWPVSQMSPHP